MLHVFEYWRIFSALNRMRFGFDSEVLINNENEKSISGLLMRINKRTNGKLCNMYEIKKNMMDHIALRLIHYECVLLGLNKFVTLTAKAHKFSIAT